MSTTKLTRKEIAADPIHDMLVNTVEILRKRANVIILAAAGVLVLVAGIYGGLNYLQSRDDRAQQELARGLDLFHGSVDAANAKDDPYAYGPMPVFRSEEAMFRAASSVFGPLASRSGSSKVGEMARYYLALCQKRLGQKNEAIASLQAVGENTSARTVGYLARKFLASYYLELGDAKKSEEILLAMLKDPQCDIPKESLDIDLSRAYVAQGKRAEALKILQEAQESGAGSALQSLVFQELSRLQSGAGNAPRP